MNGKYDDELRWPVRVNVQLELLNQAGDHCHVERSKEMMWRKDQRDTEIDINHFQYLDLERPALLIQYVMDDCIKFRIRVTPL